MYYINKDTELTSELLNKFINDFTLNRQPKMKEWKKYYEGNHAINQKSYSDVTKPCNKVTTNFAKIIVDTYAGYIAGKSVSYVSNNDITAVQQCINYNDSDAEDINWITNALSMSVGYELFWMDKDSQVRYAQTNPLNAFAIYDDTLDAELLYFVRWYDVDCFDDNNRYFIEVYDAQKKKLYECDGIGSGLNFIGEEAHPFKDVPVSVFYLNEAEESIFNCILSLQDAYNEIQSSQIDDYSAFVDAYLVVKNGYLDDETLNNMRETRAIMLESEGMDVDWLIKNSDSTNVNGILENLKENIFKVSSCIDMADDKFMAQSGEAIKYKLMSMETVASGIVAKFTKAIQRRIELISNILDIKMEEAVWRDIGIKFTRNLPVSMVETISIVNSLKGIVSDATLLSQLPFIDDVQAELEAVAKQKEEAMALYSFDMGGTDEEDEEEVA